MDKLLLSFLIVCLCKYGASSLNLPGPLVYVVTPSPRPQTEGRGNPFYYHNWMRRMDSPQNVTTSTTPTPDLIFAEFESGNNMKSIRKLLEREKIAPKTTTTTTTSTTRPIYVPDETSNVNHVSQTEENEKDDSKPVDMTDYFALYNNLYNQNSDEQVPVYIPSTASSTSKTTTGPTSTTSTTSTTIPSSGPGVENIWQIIDSQKHEQYSGQWEEESLSHDDTTTTSAPAPQENDSQTEDPNQGLDENFALPGFATNPGNGAENESRAIRTEQNMRFPYINLKPFQMKTQLKPLINSVSNSKKGNNMFTSLDNFQDIRNPVRGEAQDVVMMRQPIDRYNPAQPYLPHYGTKSKQSSPRAPPMKAMANLVPPPPPPSPKLSDGNFPAPSSYESFPPYAQSPPANPPPPPKLNDGNFPTLTNYESFPPYAASAPPAAPPPPPPPAPTPSMSYQPPVDMSDDSGSDASPGDSDGPMDIGYGYKPPSPPAKPFIPTVPPLSKPSGYSYNKPMSKPFGGYSYDKPPMANDSPPDSDDKPDFQGYQYSKPDAPSPPQDSPQPSYGHDAPSYGHDAPSYGHNAPSYEPDYPELIYDKHHGMKGGDDMKSADDMKDMGMAPPPPPPPDMKPDMDSGPPSDDHGFPNDFPGDMKFHHDFDDHDHYHHHHHTTTTTTEMPRVNRYSYYYLGKKLYYLPLYFSVYFIVYVGALIIKAVLRHKIVYPNSWKPNDQNSGYFAKRSVDSWDLSNENLHEITGKITHAIAEAGKKYIDQKKKK